MISKIFIKEDLSIKECFKKLNKTAKKTLVVIDNKNKLLGTLSNGDLRKALLKGKNLKSKIKQIYKKKCIKFNEKKIPSHEKIKKIFFLKGIDLIPIVNSKEKVVQIIYPNIKLKKNKKKNSLINFYSIIMAGGLGTRLQPFTHILPKPLIPINNKPVIEHIIDKVQEYGPKKIFVTVNYKSKVLKAFFEELKPRLKINLFFEKKPLGTCGSLKKIKIQKNIPILLLNCDALINMDLFKVLKKHIENHNDMTVLVSKKNFKMPYGVCKIDEKKNLKSILEKPSYSFSINTGMYILNKKILKFIPKNKKFDTTDLINKTISKNYKIGICNISNNAWKDVGEWKNYLIADKLNT